MNFDWLTLASLRAHITGQALSNFDSTYRPVGHRQKQATKAELALARRREFFDDPGTEGRRRRGLIADGAFHMPGSLSGRKGR